jgi:hypothetical protein
MTSFVDSIGPGCFYGSDKLRAVNFDGSKLVAVEEKGFAGTKIAEITLPKTVKRIGCSGFPLECRVSKIEPDLAFEDWCQNRLFNPSAELSPQPDGSSSAPQEPVPRLPTKVFAKKK